MARGSAVRRGHAPVQRLVVARTSARACGQRPFPSNGEHRPRRGGSGTSDRFHLVNTWKVILATIVIFGTGVVTGGLLVRQTTLSLLPHPAPSMTATRQFPPGSVGGVRLEFLRRAERELNLTFDQREQID